LVRVIDYSIQIHIYHEISPLKLLRANVAAGVDILRYNIRRLIVYKYRSINNNYQDARDRCAYI